MWKSGKEKIDGIYIYNFMSKKVVALKGNSGEYDTSDFCYIDSEYSIVSRDIKGDYDLYLVQIKTGKSWNLNQYCKDINNDRQQLGCSH